MSTSLLPRRIASRFFLPLGRDFDRLDANIRRMFEHPLAPAAMSADLPQPIGWMPPVEITEHDENLTVTAELPGIDPKHVHVELDDDVLTIRGEKQEERTEDDKNKKYHLVERSYGTFLRSFTVPSTVDPTKVSAVFEKGVLTVQMPTSKEPRPRGREIEVVMK
jgi:HSP20 family protein